MKTIVFLTILIVACTSPGTAPFDSAFDAGDCADGLCNDGEVGDTLDASCSRPCGVEAQTTFVVTQKCGAITCGYTQKCTDLCWVIVDSNAGSCDCNMGADAHADVPLDVPPDIFDTMPAGDASMALDAASETSAGTASIGSPCATAADCADGTCLTGNLWDNGYCAKTIAECPAPGSQLDVCPSGSACVTAILSGSGESKHIGDYCMKVCAQPGDCRQGDGYQCCTSGQFQDKEWCGVGCQ